MTHVMNHHQFVASMFFNSSGMLNIILERKHSWKIKTNPAKFYEVLFLKYWEKVVMNYLNVFKLLWLVHNYRVGYSHDENSLKSEKWILSPFWILVMNTEIITVRNLLEEENTSLVNTDLVRVGTYVMPNLLSALTKCSTVQLLN